LADVLELTFPRPDLLAHLNTNVVGVQLVTAAFMPLLEKGSLKKIANMHAYPPSVLQSNN
jgi:hypothetical protein